MAIAYPHIYSAIARSISALEIDAIGKKVKRVKHLQNDVSVMGLKIVAQMLNPYRKMG